MKVADIDKELETARARGPIKDIVIQPCPEVLLKLRAAVRKGDPDPAEIARIASTDVAMAAALIKVANSPLYARSRTASTVAESVALLGMGQTVSILSGFLLRRAIPVSSPLIEHFWETSTRRAMGMGYIARQLFGVDADLAHTCGLFCHVGIPVMMQGLKGYDVTLTKAMAGEDRSFTDIENSAHRTDHAVVGAIVAKTWHLPSEIAVAVRMHHDLTVLVDESLPKIVRTLVAMLVVTEHLVAMHEGVSEQKEWVQHGAKCLEFLHVQESEVQVWMDTLHAQFENEATA